MVRIILRYQSIILVGVVGALFSVSMILLLLQYTTEVDTVRKDWSEMNCLELQKFSSSTRSQLLTPEESEELYKMVESCRGS